MCSGGFRFRCRFCSWVTLSEASMYFCGLRVGKSRFVFPITCSSGRCTLFETCAITFRISRHLLPWHAIITWHDDFKPLYPVIPPCLVAVPIESVEFNDSNAKPHGAPWAIHQMHGSRETSCDRSSPRYRGTGRAPGRLEWITYLQTVHVCMHLCMLLYSIVSRPRAEITLLAFWFF